MNQRFQIVHHVDAGGAPRPESRGFARPVRAAVRAAGALRRALRVCAPLLVALCASVAGGAVPDGDVVTAGGQKVRHVPKNTTVEMWGTGVATFTASDGLTHDNINQNSAASGIYAGSKILILLDDGATLKIISPANGSVWPTILVTNGCHATIEAPIGVNFNRCVAALGTGTLTVSGTTDVSFGHSTYWPHLHLRNFRIASGSLNGIAFPNASRIASFPDGWKDFAGTVDETAPCCLTGDNLTEGWTNPRFPSKIVRIANPASLGSWQTIPDGYEFRLLPMTYPTAADYESVEFYVDWNESFSAVARADRTFTNDFTFASSTSKLTLNYPYVAQGTHYTGRLTGEGILSAVSSTGTSGAPTRAYFAGDASDFTGTVTTEYIVDKVTPSGASIDFVLSNAVARATIEAGTYGQVTFASAETPATWTVEELSTGTYVTAAGIKVAPMALSGDVSLLSGEFLIQSLGETGAIAFELGDASVTYVGAAEPAQALRAVSTDGTQKAFGAPTEGVFDATNFAARLPFDFLKIDVPANGTVTASEATRLSLDAGESATVEATAGNVTVSLAGGGTFTLDEPDVPDWSDWRDSVTHWYDFGNKADWRGISDHGTEFVETYGYTGTGYASIETDARKGRTRSYKIDGVTCKWPLVERWVDERYPDPTFPTLMNGNLYGNPSKVTDTTAPYCVLATNLYVTSTGTLSYLDFNYSSVRLPFGNDPRGCNQGNPLKVQQIVVVWNSSKNASKSIFATSEGAFARTTSSSTSPRSTTPFMIDTAYNTKVEIRTNGVPVDPSMDRPTGGWQILTVDMGRNGLDGLNFLGLGFKSAYNDNFRGGQYGELMLFTNRADDVTILMAEMYLARKWELPYDFASAEAKVAAARAQARIDAIAAFTNTVTAIGTGTVVAGKRTLRLGGNFAGTLDLQGGSLILDGGERPFDASEVAAVKPDDRVYWMDPDDTNTVTKVRWTGTGGDGGPNTVHTIVDKVAGAGHPTVIEARANVLPNLWNEARGLGPARGWLDFNHNPGYPLQAGAMLRLFAMPEDFDPTEDLDSTCVTPADVQTAFVVQDSLRGGGSPLRDALKDGAITPRARASVSYPMWPGSSTLFSGGESRLDGVTVDQSKGFGGKPEVLSVRGTGPITSVGGDYTRTWTIGDHNNTLAPYNDGEIIGEVLLYSDALSDAQMAGIEAYLMQKWLGYLPSGFTDARQVTVTGTGTVTLESFGNLPKADGDFSGTVVITDPATTVAMTAKAASSDEVSGAIVFPGAALERPVGTYEIAVSLDSKKVSRRVLHRYTVLDVGSLAGGVAFTAKLAGSNWPSDTRIEQNAAGTKIEVVIPARAHGLMIIYK